MKNLHKLSDCHFWNKLYRTTVFNNLNISSRYQIEFKLVNVKGNVINEYFMLVWNPQATRTPTRDSAGIALLLRYYNQLYFIERRFFPPDRSLGIYFEWFDSLTGVPSCQRTVAFEKASILFNAGALYTQLAAKQDRLTARGLDQAVDAFLRAAGTFRYIHENFTNAPSMDLGPDMLEMLVQLMLVSFSLLSYNLAFVIDVENKELFYFAINNPLRSCMAYLPLIIN